MFLLEIPLHLKYNPKLGMVADACAPSTQETEAGGFWWQTPVLPVPRRLKQGDFEFEAS